MTFVCAKFLGKKFQKVMGNLVSRRTPLSQSNATISVLHGFECIDCIIFSGFSVHCIGFLALEWDDMQIGQVDQNHTLSRELSIGTTPRFFPLDFVFSVIGSWRKIFGLSVRLPKFKGTISKRVRIYGTENEVHYESRFTHVSVTIGALQRHGWPWNATTLTQKLTIVRWQTAELSRGRVELYMGQMHWVQGIADRGLCTVSGVA
ncbi:hypothetical protein B0H13DRAFT_1918503 [Mycena leptocephala]|nr:hypothetical protein B0H13DRAFT_1918503 [Mycena leptocephala]